MLGISEEKKNNILKKLRKNNFKILSIKYGDDDDEDDIFNNNINNKNDNKNIKNTTNTNNKNNKNNNKHINNKPFNKTNNKTVKNNHTKINNSKEEVKPKSKTSLTINQSIIQQKKLNKIKK